MSKDLMGKIKQGVLARFEKTEEELKAELKFEAIFILVATLRLGSCLQVVTDIVASKDGTILGPRRTAKDP